MTICITHPLAEWLDANGIDWRKTVAWPRVEVSYTNSEIRIEEFDQDAEGQPKVYKAGNTVLTKMTAYTMLVPPFPPMLADYQRTRQHELVIQDIVKKMTGPTLIVADAASHLVFVTKDEIDRDDLEVMHDELRTMLPEVRVSIVSGIDHIVVEEKP